MNRHDVRSLQAIRSYPSISILFPTHRTAPDSRQDAIRLKNLVKEAEDRLLNEFGKRDVTPLLARLDEMVSEIDHNHNLDGMAIFVNRDMGLKYDLPFPVQERVLVEETFATRDLVFALNRSYRYWALTLSENSCRLFDGIRDTLTEIKEGIFPMTHTGPGGASKLPGGPGINPSAVRDESHRQFFRRADTMFRQIAEDDPLPLALAGIERYQAFYREVAQRTDDIVAVLSGSYDHLGAHDLGRLIWPLVQEGMAEQRRQALAELEDAVSAGKFVAGIGEVFRLAKEGRGKLLLVEQDFHYPARVDETGMHLTGSEETGPNALDDAVDEAVEAVLVKGGRVIFTDNGALSQYQRIALILRY
jgi:hypothetical protein